MSRDSHIGHANANAASVFPGRNSNAKLHWGKRREIPTRTLESRLPVERRLRYDKNQYVVSAPLPTYTEKLQYVYRLEYVYMMRKELSSLIIADVEFFKINLPSRGFAQLSPSRLLVEAA